MVRKDNDDIFKAIDTYLERKGVAETQTGVVVSVTPISILVRVSGSAQVQEAEIIRGGTVGPGENVVLMRPLRTQKWVIIGAFALGLLGRGATTTPQARVEIAPPSSFRLLGDSLIDGHAVLTWEVPIQQPVAFQIEMNTAESEIGGTVVLTTRGSYAIIELTQDQFFRIRSVSPEALFSGWSEWVEVELPDDVPDGSPYIPIVTECGMPIFYMGRPWGLESDA